MDYSKDYSKIFAQARVVLNDELERYVKTMEYGMAIGHKHSLLYITMVADTLTAYNELYPYLNFVHARSFRQY